MVLNHKPRISVRCAAPRKSAGFECRKDEHAHRSQAAKDLPVVGHGVVHRLQAGSQQPVKTQNTRTLSNPIP